MKWNNGKPLESNQQSLNETFLERMKNGEFEQVIQRMNGVIVDKYFNSFREAIY